MTIASEHRDAACSVCISHFTAALRITQFHLVLFVQSNTEGGSEVSPHRVISASFRILNWTEFLWESTVSIVLVDYRQTWVYFSVGELSSLFLTKSPNRRLLGETENKNTPLSLYLWGNLDKECNFTSGPFVSECEWVHRQSVPGVNLKSNTLWVCGCLSRDGSLVLWSVFGLCWGFHLADTMWF